MLKEETKQLLTILEVAYPSNYRNLNPEERRNTLVTYYDMFAEYPTELIVMALKNYIKVNQYPPTIAGLREQVEMLLDKDTPVELWNKVKKAITRSAYNSVEEFAKLPPVCQKWVGNHMTLKELSQTDIDTLDTVTRGQFLKTIGSIQQRTEAQAALPESLKAQIMQLTGKMQIEG
jgi:hypothetical protein